MKTSVKFNNKEESKKVEKKLFTDEELIKVIFDNSKGEIDE